MFDPHRRTRAKGDEAPSGPIPKAPSSASGSRAVVWECRRQTSRAAGNFSDLHTRDAKAAIAFYTEAFGWQFDDVGFATMIRRPGYGDHQEATIDPDIRKRQAGATAPPGFEDAIAWFASPGEGESAHWHVTFNVADRDQTVADAERLGAAVLAHEDSSWTRTALIRDPQGALFTPPSV